jgi:hypothetical protein
MPARVVRSEEGLSQTKGNEEKHQATAPWPVVLEYSSPRSIKMKRMKKSGYQGVQPSSWTQATVLEMKERSKEKRPTRHQLHISTATNIK